MQKKAKLGLVVTSVLVAACGGSVTNANGNDAGSHPDAAKPNQDAAADTSPPKPDAEAGPSFPFPALLPENPPQVVSLGGPVMASPKIVPIFFATDDPTTTAKIADFVSKVGQTKYWIANVAEYGGGAATGLPPIQLTSADNPPATFDDSSIQLWLANKLNSDDPAFPTPDENTLYALFYPPNVTITIGGTPTPTGDGGVDSGASDGGMDAGGGGGGFGGVQSSCTDFGGYHENITLDSAHGGAYASLAVIPRCDMFGPILKGFDVTTGAASHEFIEAATDPQPYAIPAYVQVDTPHEYWERVLGGGEVCDMCAQFPSSFTKFSELPYTVQRCWSNKAEKAGTDPCVPETTGEVYFNAYPELTNVTSSFEGMTTTVLGVDIPVGSSKVVTLDLFSDGPTQPWTVSAEALGSATTSNLDFSFDKTTGQNGDKIQMTIKVTAASMRNHEEFIVTSTLGTAENIWVGFVAN